MPINQIIGEDLTLTNICKYNIGGPKGVYPKVVPSSHASWTPVGLETKVAICDVWLDYTWLANTDIDFEVDMNLGKTTCDFTWTYQK